MFFFKFFNPAEDRERLISRTQPDTHEHQTMNPTYPPEAGNSNLPTGSNRKRSLCTHKSAADTGSHSGSTSTPSKPSSPSSPQSSLFVPSTAVSHNPGTDLHIPARRPKTPPPCSSLIYDIEDGPGGRISSRPLPPTQAPIEVWSREEGTVLLSPNNTPMSGPAIDSFGSMNKPSPNNTPMCDRYAQDRGAVYPANVPGALTSPSRVERPAEVKYGAASSVIDRDNGTSWSSLNHVRFGDK